MTMQQENTEKRLFTYDEAAEFLTVSSRTVKRFVKDGKLRATRLGSRKAVRIERSDLETFIEKSKTTN